LLRVKVPEEATSTTDVFLVGFAVQVQSVTRPNDCRRNVGRARWKYQIVVGTVVVVREVHAATLQFPVEVGNGAEEGFVDGQPTAFRS
jgi:hypothetical protein